MLLAPRCASLKAQCYTCYGTSIWVESSTGMCDGRVVDGYIRYEQSYCDSGTIKLLTLAYYTWEDCGTVHQCSVSSEGCY
jgi:hypothetical protein